MICNSIKTMTEQKKPDFLTLLFACQKTLFRGYRPAGFIKTLIPMQHEGSFHLDDIRYLQDDKALRTVLGLNRLPGVETG